MKILQIACVIFAITVFSVIGFAIRSKVLDRKIENLQSVLNKQQAVIDSMQNDIGVTDAQSEKDRTFLELMFSEIFTFYDYDGFKEARQSARDYNLSNAFINAFYDTSELSGAYADAMLDVLCRYESSDLYLLDRQDGNGYYVAVVTLGTVKYNTQFDIVLIIVLAENGEEGDRVQYITYYNIG